jgi:hypothetical protein
VLNAAPAGAAADDKAAAAAPAIKIIFVAGKYFSPLKGTAHCQQLLQFSFTSRQTILLTAVILIATWERACQLCSRNITLFVTIGSMYNTSIVTIPFSCIFYQNQYIVALEIYQFKDYCY